MEKMERESIKNEELVERPILEVEGGDNGNQDENCYKGPGFSIGDYFISIHGELHSPKLLLGFNYKDTTDGFDKPEIVYGDLRLKTSIVNFFQEMGVACLSDFISYGEYNECGIDEDGTVFTMFNIETELVENILNRFPNGWCPIMRSFDIDFDEDIVS